MCLSSTYSPFFHGFKVRAEGGMIGYVAQHLRIWQVLLLLYPKVKINSENQVQEPLIITDCAHC